MPSNKLKSDPSAQEEDLVFKKMEYKVISSRLTKTIVDRIDEIAKHSNMSRNQVLTNLLEYALEHTVLNDE